jgi:hypothetical protein
MQPDSSVEDSTFQLVLDQLEELVVTIVDEIRERPGVALAILAGIIGAIVGAGIAGRASRRGSPPTRRAERSARSVAGAADVGMALLKNPLVRGLVVSLVSREFKRRMSQ